MIDHFVLEDGCAQFGQSLLVLGVIFPDRLFLAGIGPGALDERLGHFLVRDLRDLSQLDLVVIHLFGGPLLVADPGLEGAREVHLFVVPRH